MLFGPWIPFLGFSGQNDGFTLGILGACTAATLQLCGYGCIWNMASREKREKGKKRKSKVRTFLTFSVSQKAISGPLSRKRAVPAEQFCTGLSSVPHW